MKLVEALRYSGGQVQGYARNKAVDHQPDALASHALVVEVACHYRGPNIS